MDGPTIRDYIEARKKNGMTWEDFRKLKEEKEGPGVSDAAMAKYRQQLDDERESKLSAGRKRARQSEKEKKKKKSSSKHKKKHHRSKSDEEDVLSDDERESKVYWAFFWY
ncbi:hypothetical protein CLU79DRAFT_725468 [Phycomyces nitens]|nr:hypothetical protein CLU79DRAFT_725468 [Phycomyces nitens]